MTKTKLVGVNERGLRVGEDHQRAKFTDGDIELMRKLHEDDGLGYRRIARIFECSRSFAARVCRYEIRVQAACKFRTVIQLPDGRPQGEDCPQAKLTNAQATQIRERVSAGENRQSVADEFGVSLGALGYVVRCETYTAKPRKALAYKAYVRAEDGIVDPGPRLRDGKKA